MISNLHKIGSKGKVGLILPSANTVTEPVFYALAPYDISFHTSRTFITGTSIEDVIAMEKEKGRAIRELASTKPDCIVDCCTASGIIRGMEEDKAFCEKVEHNIGLHTTSTLQSIVKALQAINVKKLVIITPYPKEMDKLEELFFKGNGFNVINIKGLNITEATALAAVPPNDIYRFCIESWDTGAEGLLISCMNFNPTPIIQALELMLKVPVVSSNTATLWKILRMLGIKEPVFGYGKLLSDYIC